MATSRIPSGKPELVLGVMTAGGNAPGYNPFVRGVVDLAKEHNSHDNPEIVRILGMRFGIGALLKRQDNLADLTAENFSTTENRFSGSGSELGNSRGFIGTAEQDPEKMKIIQDNVAYYREQYGMRGMIVGGGDGSLMGLRNAQEAGGFPFNQVPITIDDDILGTDISVGLDSATVELDHIVKKQIRDVAGHQRIILIQVMGRDSGQVAFKGGRRADIILIGECPVSNEKIIQRVKDVYLQKECAVVVVGENFRPEGFIDPSNGTDPAGNETKGNRVQYLEQLLQNALYEECRPIAPEDRFVRSLDTSSIIRAASPTPFDDRLAYRMGSDATFLAISGEMGYMVTRRGTKQVPVPLSEIRGGKQVDPAEYDYDRLQKNRVSFDVRDFVRRRQS